MPREFPHMREHNALRRHECPTAHGKGCRVCPIKRPQPRKQFPQFRRKILCVRRTAAGAERASLTCVKERVARNLCAAVQTAFIGLPKPRRRKDLKYSGKRRNARVARLKRRENLCEPVKELLATKVA